MFHEKTKPTLHSVKELLRNFTLSTLERLGNNLGGEALFDDEIFLEFVNSYKLRYQALVKDINTERNR